MNKSSTLWANPITVVIDVNEKFHIGGGKETVDALVPITKREPYATTGLNITTVNVISSFKGILNTTMNMMINSLSLLQEIANTDTLRNLTGYEIPEEQVENLGDNTIKYLPKRITKEGKLYFIFLSNKSNVDELVRNSQIRIAIDSYFDTVKTGGIYELEFVQHKEGKTIKLAFKIIPKIPLTTTECILLYVGLRGLKYSGFGGYASTGYGIIENVIISQEFETFVLEKLKEEITKNEGEPNRN